jgi:hypothetical protein
MRKLTVSTGVAAAIVLSACNDSIELRNTVLEIRKLEGVTDTKTLVALDRTRHVARDPEGRPIRS